MKTQLTLATNPLYHNKQLNMKDFMLTEVTRTAKYTEVYFDEFQKHY